MHILYVYILYIQYVCVPVQIDKDDTLRVVYQPFQLSGLVPQICSLYEAVQSHCMNTVHYMYMVFNIMFQ